MAFEKNIHAFLLDPPFTGEPPINTRLPFTESTLVRYDVTAINDTKAMLAAVHETGAYSCADVIVLGSDVIRTHNSNGLLGIYETHLLHRAVRCVTGYELQTGRAPRAMWSLFYNDLREASPVIFVPSDDPAYYSYTRLAATGLLKARVPVGKIIDPSFMKRYWLDRRDRIRHKEFIGEIPESKADDMLRGLHSCEEVADEFIYGDVKPAVDAFDVAVRYPRIREAQAAARLAIDEARGHD